MDWCHRSVIVVSFALAAVSADVSADEGMWPLYELDKLSFAQYAGAGLQLQSEDIYSSDGGGLYQAVVRIGATGSFVSSDGLIITNHHVAYGAVQKQSTAEVNLIREGFYAPTRADELPAPGYTASVTLSMYDVTDRVLAGVTDDMTDLERYEAVDRAIKAIVAEAELNGGVKARVSAMFAGTQYVLFREFRIRDIRIVYVPPEMIGVYGGDIDNWMWPRHTGDFSFLRAYVAPDGSPAEYAPDNVPYHPSRFLPIAKDGVSEGDFTMIIGFPGHTNRYASSYQVDDLINYSYPTRIELYRDILGIIERLSSGDPETAVRLQSRVQGYNNGLKNRIGMLEGFSRGGLLDQKRAAERELAAFIDADDNLRRIYSGILPGLDSLYNRKHATRTRDLVLGLLTWSDHPEMAFEIYRWAKERRKTDPERDRGYQDRDSTETREWLEDAQINLVPSYDRALLRYALLRAAALPDRSRIRLVDDILTGAEGSNREEQIDNWLDSAFARTRIGDLERRMSFFRMSVEKLEALNEPFIDFAKALYPDMEEMRLRDKAHYGTSSRLEPKLIAAYADWRKHLLYPDANSTMRVNFGTVDGYRADGGQKYSSFTTVSGVLEKETGEYPFIVPDQLKAGAPMSGGSHYVYAPIEDVPVNFLSTNDATGGNSGSPVIDGRGRLVGVLFDGNYEGITSDYMFDAEKARAINVDIRYVLYLLDEVYHLDALLSELNIE
jgi:hypothetical protein